MQFFKVSGVTILQLSYYNGYTFSWIGRQLVGAVNGNNTYSFTYNDEGIRTSNCFGGKIFPTNAGWFQPRKISSVFTKPYGQKILLQTVIGSSFSGTVNFARKNNWNKFVFIVPALP